MIAGSAALGAALTAVLALIIAVPAVRGETPPPEPAATDVSDDPPSVTIVGDSWSEGIGATGLHGFAELAPEQLGWNHRLLAVGGSGYVAPGRGSTFGERIDRAVAGDPDVVVLQGSQNDRHATPEALRDAAASTLMRMRAAAGPDTVILVIGAARTPDWDGATIDPINDAVGEAAELAGVRFVDPVAERWIDPEDERVWMDGSHLNDVGHQLVADRLKRVLRSAVRS